MNKLVLLVVCFSLLLQLNLFGQCGDRYQTEIFDELTISTVVYSDTTGFEVDVYEPTDDTLAERPLLIFAHSGAFFTGEKDSDFMQSICSRFAKMGYVTASIQYTLAESDELISDSLYMHDIIVQSVLDAKAAVRYFRGSVANGNPYGIDSRQIWIGGNSAGGILSTQLAFLDSDDAFPQYMLEIIESHGGLEGDRGNSDYSSHVNGVINLAGGIINSSWLDAGETEALISCHGSLDDIVDINCNKLFWNFGYFADLDLFKIFGSGAVHNQAEQVGMDHTLFTFEGLNHVPWLLDGEVQDEMIGYVQSFLFDRLACQIESSTTESIINEIKIYPNPSNGVIKIEHERRSQDMEVSLWNSNGSFIGTLIGNNGICQLVQYNIQNGSYYVKVRIGNEIYSERIIINR